uniref:Uncharacterized protein n=1 Tax=Anopheles atroparvus TaxID=41427 RepID=A0A182IXH2_ANOAO
MILSNVIKLSRNQSPGPSGQPSGAHPPPAESAQGGVFPGGDECASLLHHPVDREGEFAAHGGASMGLSDDGSSLLDGMALEGGGSGGGWSSIACMDTTSCPSMADET